MLLKDWLKTEESIEASEKYAASLRRHIAAVQIYGAKIGVESERVAKHDLSKWSVAEFMPYAQHFYGDKGDPTAMAKAWLHHLNANDHHWNHWIFIGGWQPEGADCEDGVLEMPEPAALEMVADWHGASYAYTDSWDISGWLKKSAPIITLHTRTAAYIREVLYRLGYDVSLYVFAHEQTGR